MPLLKSLCASTMNTGNVSMAGSPYCKLISWKSLIQVLLNSPLATEGSSSIEHFSPLWGWWVRCVAGDNGCQVWRSNHLLGKTLVITSKLFGLRRQLILCGKIKGSLQRAVLWWSLSICLSSVCLQTFFFALSRCNHAFYFICLCVGQRSHRASSCTWKETALYKQKW